MMTSSTTTPRKTSSPPVVAQQHSHIEMKDFDFSFESVFDMEECKHVFKQYLESTHNSESLLFLEQVELYQAKKSSKNRFTHAKQIIKEFVEPGAKNEINVGKTQRSSVQETFKKECTEDDCSKILFDQLVSTVFLELKEDAFNKFISSSLFREFVERHVTEKGEEFLSSFATRKKPLPSNDRDTSSSGASSSEDNSAEEFQRNACDSSESEETLTFTDKSCPMDVTNPYIVEEYFDWVLNEVSTFPNETIWEKMKTSDKSVTGRAMYLSHKMYSVKEEKRKRFCRKMGETVVLPFNMEEVLYAILDVDFAKNVEELLMSSEFVEYHKIGKQIQYPVSVVSNSYKCNWPMQNRDFVTAMSLRKESSSKYILIRKSCRISAKPKAKGLVRAEGIGGIVVEQIAPNKTLYSNISLVDFNGWLPLRVWNSILKYRDESVVRGLFEAVEKRRAKYCKLPTDCPPPPTNSHYVYDTLVELEKYRATNV